MAVDVAQILPVQHLVLPFRQMNLLFGSGPNCDNRGLLESGSGGGCAASSGCGGGDGDGGSTASSSAQFFASLCVNEYLRLPAPGDFCDHGQLRDTGL